VQADPPASRPSAPAAAPATQVTLIGAGHVFRIEEAIAQAVQALRPDLVCVELDAGRLQGLLQRQRTGHVEMAGGFVHRRLAAFQEGVAGLYGADAGNEMLAAVQAGQAVGARVALVDDPVEGVLERVLKEMTLREKLRGAGMLVAGRVRSWFPGRDAKEQVEAELKRYQDDPDAMMGEIRRQFPTVHRILIAERDQRMAQRIRAGAAGSRHVLAVLGDAHLNGMLPLLADLRPTVYRLRDVREGRLPRGLVATGTPEKVGFTVRYG
jgi:pheromone shutdown protein TraB